MRHGDRLFQEEGGRDVFLFLKLDCYDVVEVLQTSDLVDDGESKLDELEAILYVALVERLVEHFLDAKSSRRAPGIAAIVDSFLEDSSRIFRILKGLDEDLSLVLSASRGTIEAETELDTVEV